MFVGESDAAEHESGCGFIFMSLLADTEFRFSYTLFDYVSAARLALGASGAFVEDTNSV